MRLILKYYFIRSRLIAQRLLNPNSSSINLDELKIWTLNAMGTTEEQLKRDKSADSTLSTTNNNN